MAWPGRPPHTRLSDNRIARQASVSSPHPPSPLPGAPSHDAVLNHSPWDWPQGSGAAQALLRPCMARVLYLACENGSRRPGGKAQRYYCASCPGAGAGTAYPGPWPPTPTQAGTYTRLNRRGNGGGTQEGQVTRPGPHRWKRQSRGWTSEGGQEPVRGWMSSTALL